MLPLTDDQLAWIASFGPEFSAAQVSKAVGCSAQTVCDIRRGDRHGERLAQLSRGTYCINCRYFDAAKGGCLFRFPDLELHGPAFARDCALYSRNELLLTDSQPALAPA